MARALKQWPRDYPPMTDTARRAEKLAFLAEQVAARDYEVLHLELEMADLRAKLADARQRHGDARARLERFASKGAPGG